MGLSCRAWAADSRAAGTGSPGSTRRSRRNLDSVSSQQPFLSEGRLMPPPLSQSMHESTVDGPGKRTKRKAAPEGAALQPAEKVLVLDICTQEPRRVPSSADDGIKLKSRFPGDMRLGKTLFRPQVCEQRECAPRTASFLRNACISERACRVSRHAQKLPRKGQLQTEIIRLPPFLRTSSRPFRPDRG